MFSIAILGPWRPVVHVCVSKLEITIQVQMILHEISFANVVCEIVAILSHWRMYAPVDWVMNGSANSLFGAKPLIKPKLSYRWPDP